MTMTQNIYIYNTVRHGNKATRQQHKHAIVHWMGQATATYEYLLKHESIVKEF